MNVPTIAAELRRERARLAAERDRIESQLGPGAEGEAESAASRGERGLDDSVEEALDNVLRQIETALRRIEAGSYGTCERCGKVIAAARLEALPYAVRCVDCADLHGRAAGGGR